MLEPAFGAVFVVADYGSLLEGAHRLAPALVAVDVSLAHGDIRHLLHSIRERAPGAKVLLLSVHDEAAVVDAALSAGADGVVFKRAIADDLLPAVDALLAGHRYMSSARPHPR